MKDWDEKINKELETEIGCDVKIGNLRVNMMNVIKKKEEDTAKLITMRINQVIKA